MLSTFYRVNITSIVFWEKKVIYGTIHYQFGYNSLRSYKIKFIWLEAVNFE